jgi:hypothetical protein
MQTIVVDREPIVKPQLASIIRNDPKSIMASVEDSHAGCPARSEVITSVKARPMATCVPVVHSMTPSGHVRPSTVQVLTASTLAKVEGVLHEEPVAVRDSIRQKATAP